jgi:glycosyltransferase involved in cell wall biosynthesis
MLNKPENLRVSVVIPAFNEEKSIPLVIKDIPKEWVNEVIVVSNNSTDKTDEVAKEAGATVLRENRKGYGWACILGIEYAVNQKSDIIIFLDGDYSDYPQQIPEVLTPILINNVDLVIGSRALGVREKGSMTFPQIFGNWLATNMMRVFYGVKYTDLGPFRAIKVDKLLSLNMSDKTYGWTIEMQIKAAKNKLTHAEVPVNYKNRIGKSKVSGTVKGTIMAGIKIIGAIFKYKFEK